MLVGTKKRCYKCKRELPLEDFHKSHTRKDGLCNCCKKCKAQRSREHREKNRDKLNRQSREWRKNNKEKDLLYHQGYRRDHRRELGQQSKEYRSTVLGHLANVFHSMRRRCGDPDTHNYSRYGGRGIQNKFESLDTFRDYVINVLWIDPRGLQIDRIDNDGHYEKGNIRFVTAKENCANRGEAQNR